MSKTYYFIIEDCAEGTGSHGYRNSHDDAEKEVRRMEDLFPESSWYVHPNDDKNEPVFVTL